MSIRRTLAAVASVSMLTLLIGCGATTVSSTGPSRSLVHEAAPAPTAVSSVGPTQSFAPEEGTGSAAGGSNNYQPHPSDPIAMRQAWTRWKTLHEPDYDLSVQLWCYCPPKSPVLTRVRDGDVVYVVRGNRAGHEISRNGWTMERLFLLMRSAYGAASSVQVRYTKDGVPLRISIDPRKNLADDETYYRVALDRRD